MHDWLILSRTLVSQLEYGLVRVVTLEHYLVARLCVVRTLPVATQFLQ